MTTERGHGRWLYACGHDAYHCKCPHHVSDQPHYLSDLCPGCRARLQPLPEPFPKATD